jgi:hypothetical protein
MIIVLPSLRIPPCSFDTTLLRYYGCYELTMTVQLLPDRLKGSRGWMINSILVVVLCCTYWHQDAYALRTIVTTTVKAAQSVDSYTTAQLLLCLAITMR